MLGKPIERLKLSNFKYEIPRHLIAQYPAEPRGLGAPYGG